MLKGKSKIELFNAGSGKKESEFINENMITSAVSKVFSPQIKELIYLTGYPTKFLNESLPLLDSAYAGLLLFDDYIEENPDIIYKPDNVNNIGYAGFTYSGNNVYRGTRNQNESGIIYDSTNLNKQIGYRRVWDFSSDRALGTIKCMSLTSRAGGDTGYTYENKTTAYNENGCAQIGTNLFSQGGTLNAIQMNITPSDLSGETLLGLSYAGIDTDGRFYVIFYTTGGLYKTKFRDFNNFGILTNSFVPYGANANGCETVKISALTVPSYAKCSYGYDEKIHLIYTPNSTTIIHKTFNKQGVLENEKTVTLTGGTAYGRDYGGTFDGTYYFARSSNSNNTSVFTADGSFVKTIDNVIQNYDPFVKKTYSGYSSNGYYRKFHDGNDYCGYEPSGSSAYQDGYSPILDTALYPLLGHVGNVQSSYSYFAINFFISSLFLSTINNLETPVEKTANQTMKITYEIVEQGENNA